MSKRPFLSLLAAISAVSPAPAALTTFNYTQTDSTTGSGTIAPFTYDDGGGPINFTATTMPAANVFNPAPGNTPAGYVGAQLAPTGNSNEANVAVGLLWSGLVTATGTRGGSTFQIDIPLRYVPKQTQAPDTNDYNWSVAHGDGPGVDVSGGGFRFAMYLSRDSLADSAETPDTFQRYTQQTLTFNAGVIDSFNNTDTSSAAIKDATDPGGAPAGVDAAGRDLAAYWAWRDGGALPGGGAMLVDTFAFGGLLDADVNSLRLIPEPSAAMLAFGAAGLLLRRRRS